MSAPSPDDPRRCQKHKSNGEPCTQWAMKGQTACFKHGGKSPQALKAAARRIAEQNAQHAVVLYGLPQEIDPHTALLDELWRTAGHVAWLRDRVAELQNQGQLHGPVGNPEHMMAEQPHIWLRLYQEERRHLTQVAAACIKAGIEERRVKLAEDQGALLAQVIRGILEDLGVAENPEVGKVVRKHLSLVGSG